MKGPLLLQPLPESFRDPFLTPEGTSKPLTVLWNGAFVTTAAFLLVQRMPVLQRWLLSVVAVCHLLYFYRLRRLTVDKYGGVNHAFIHSYWGVSEAWLSMSLLIYPLYVLAFDAWCRCQGQASVLAADRLAAFAMLWSVYDVASRRLSLGSHVQFYSWFNTSGIEMATRRGLGSRGFAPYGLQIPRCLGKRLPEQAQNFIKAAWHLSLQRFRLVGDLTTLTLLSITLKLTPPAMHCTITLPLFILHTSQLFANTNCGMHKPLLVPAVLVYLMLAPQLWSVEGAWGSHVGAAWPAAYLKIHILSIYFAAGVGKPLTAAAMKKWWASGTLQQYYLYVAMWARPGADLQFLELLGFLVQRPRLCAVMSFAGLFWEVVAPILAIWGSFWSVGFFLSAVGLHAIIFATQGIDFFCQWVPALLIFAVDTNPITIETLFPAGGFVAASHVERCCWLLSTLHLLAQLLLCFTCWELLVSGDKGCLPFTSMQMFTIPKNIFGDDFFNWFTMMSGDQRCAGHLGVMEWSGPVFVDHHLSVEDMHRLPFKVLYFGHTMSRHPQADRFIVEEFQRKKFLLFANFEISKRLEHILRNICSILNESCDEDAWNGAKLQELVELTKECQHTFRKDLSTLTRARITRKESFMNDESLQQMLKEERRQEYAGKLERAVTTRIAEGAQAAMHVAS